MFFHQTQEQIPFHEMSPRERLAFLIHKSDFEPSEFGLALTAIGFSGQTIWAGWPPSQNVDFIWSFPMLLLGLAQMVAWWLGRGQAGRYLRAVLAFAMAAFWLFLLLTFGGGAHLWLFLLPAYTSFWAFYRLVLRIYAAAWVEGRRG